MSRLDLALNIADLKKMAARKLPAPLFNYIDGGADDEGTRHGNVTAFKQVKLIPEYLVDVSSIDTSTTVLGQTINLTFGTVVESRHEMRKDKEANFNTPATGSADHVVATSAE